MIGNTPMIRLKSEPKVFVKLEKYNPWSSIKDRPALFMVEAAEKHGKIKNNVIVEPTSGNTGIALSGIGALKGYRVILTMPENVNKERISLLRALGADVILTPSDKGMKGAIDRAIEIRDETGGYMPNQFENPYNPLSHRITTACEILRQTNYHINVFVAGVGTGGTITGVGKLLKELYGQKVKIVAVEPAKSPMLSKGVAGKHGIQGIGAGFIPKILDCSVIDEIVTVEDEEAIATTKFLLHKEGLTVGISSGANISVAMRIAQNMPENSVIVTIAPDHYERYLSVMDR